MNRHAACSAVLLAALLSSSSLMASDVPQRLHVQGVLSSGTGTPAPGTYNVQMRLFATEVGGSALVQQSLTGVQADGGLFDAVLEPVPQAVIDAHGVLWLELQIGTDSPLPRQALMPSAFALRARRADSASDVACTGCVGGADIGSGAVGSGQVGFNYAAGNAKGGAATDVACDTCVDAGEVSFPWAAANTAGGTANAAATLSCSGCVDAGHLGTGSVGAAELQTGAVGSGNVSFKYAEGDVKGGAAVNVKCADCIDATEVSFAWAAASSAGGPASAAASLSCSGCVGASHLASGSVGASELQAGAVGSGNVSFNYAASSAKGGPATDLACSGCVSAGEVAFNYAGSSSVGGPATSAIGLSCTGCVGSSQLAGGAVGAAHIQAGAVGSSQVSFNYAAGDAKGGAAVDVECVGCVDSGDVGFNWAGSSSKGGAASSAAALSCTGCVGASHLASGSVGSAQIKSGAVLASHMGFDYAVGNSAGAATDVACSGCVGSSDLTSSLSLTGDISVKGSITACNANASSCSLAVGTDVNLVRSSGYLNVQSPSGARIRNAADSGWTNLYAGLGTFYAGLTVNGSSTLSGSTSVGGTLDMNGNQIVAMRFQAASSAPTSCSSSKVGYAYYDTGTGGLMICDGSSFKSTCSACEGGGPDPNSCAGHCNTSAPGGCWCDSICVAEGDCCDDACSECGQCNTAPNSCVGNCGDSAPSGCWCDDLCVEYGDCCYNACSACGEC